MDAIKDPHKLAKVFDCLNKIGKDFRVIFSIPFTSNAQAARKFIEQLFVPHIDKFLVMAFDPTWEQYNLFLNASDYWMGTNSSEHFPVSFQDAWQQKCIPVVPRSEIFEELLPDDLHDRHMFKEYDPMEAARMLEEFDKDREGVRATIPPVPWAKPMGVYAEHYLKMFDDMYASFYADVKVVEKGSIAKMMDLIRKGPVLKRELFEHLGWSKPTGWSTYRFKLHKLGVLSKRNKRGMVYYMPEHAEQAEKQAQPKQRRTLF